MLNICAKFHKNLTFTFREITTSVTKKRTNQQTYPITIPPVNNNSLSLKIVRSRYDVFGDFGTVHSVRTYLGLHTAYITIVLYYAR